MTITDRLKQAIDAYLEWEKLPIEYRKTRNGWAAFRGQTRVTKWHWTEQAAREDVIEQQARNIRVE